MTHSGLDKFVGVSLGVKGCWPIHWDDAAFSFVKLAQAMA